MGKSTGLCFGMLLSLVLISTRMLIISCTESSELGSILYKNAIRKDQHLAGAMEMDEDTVRSPSGSLMESDGTQTATDGSSAVVAAYAHKADGGTVIPAMHGRIGLEKEPESTLPSSGHFNQEEVRYDIFDISDILKAKRSGRKIPPGESLSRKDYPTAIRLNNIPTEMEIKLLANSVEVVDDSDARLLLGYVHSEYLDKRITLFKERYDQILKLLEEKFATGKNSASPEECGKIVQDLQNCLKVIFDFPHVDEETFDLTKSKALHERFVKNIYQAIESMYNFGLITNHQMIDFFDHETSLIAGIHLTYLYQIEEDVGFYKEFHADADYFKYDPRTYYLHRCLTDIPEEIKGKMIHSAICHTLQRVRKRDGGLEQELMLFAAYFSKKLPLDNSRTSSRFLERLSKLASEPYEVEKREMSVSASEFKTDHEKFAFEMKIAMLDCSLRYGNFEKIRLRGIRDFRVLKVAFLVRDWKQIGRIYQESFLELAKRPMIRRGSYPFFLAQYEAEYPKWFQNWLRIRDGLYSNSDNMYDKYKDLVWLP